MLVLTSSLTRICFSAAIKESHSGAILPLLLCHTPWLGQFPLWHPKETSSSSSFSSSFRPIKTLFLQEKMFGHKIHELWKGERRRIKDFGGGAAKTRDGPKRNKGEGRKRAGIDFGWKKKKWRSFSSSIFIGVRSGRSHRK